MSTPKPLDWRGILERAGADEVAAEGTQGHSLSLVAAAVAELIAANIEYDAARRDWDNARYEGPENLRAGAMKLVASRYENAIARRAAALAAVGGGLPA